GHEDQLTVGDLLLDVARHEVRRGQSEIELTAKEFDLLAYLMRNAGRVLSKDQITEHVWGYDSQATSNVVEIYIHYLRDKIDRGFARPLIRTVRGVGYTTYRADQRPREAAIDLDRKSTRLNSSHVATSYAVFCLKKKTIDTPR